jgi:hypothetical protein
MGGGTGQRTAARVVELYAHVQRKGAARASNGSGRRVRPRGESFVAEPLSVLHWEKRSAPTHGTAGLNDVRREAGRQARWRTHAGGCVACHRALGTGHRRWHDDGGWQAVLAQSAVP